MDHKEFREIVDRSRDEDMLDALRYALGPNEKLLLPVGKQNEMMGMDYASQVEMMQKNSKLYTPPPVEYEEPAEDLYDWYTGKVRGL